MNLIPPNLSEQGESTYSMLADLPRKRGVLDRTGQSPPFARNCFNNRLQLSTVKTKPDVSAPNILSTLNGVVKVESEIV